MGADSIDPSQTVQQVEHAESIETFEWRDLHFHVVTDDPLTDQQIATIRQMLPKISGVGVFADLLAMILGRRVRIRTERPSSDVRFELGR